MSIVRIGSAAAIIAGVSTAIFATSILFHRMLLVSFGMSMVLSWAYIVLACAFASETNQDQRVFAFAGLSFAIMYAVFVDLVYFTQLTVVNHGNVPNDVMNVLKYVPGSWMFAFDLFGYGMMAISTFLVGLTISPTNRNDQWLKFMLMFHGLFAPVSIAFPIVNSFASTASVKSASSGGVIGLEGWSVFFVIIMILSVKHFRDRRFTLQKARG